MMDSTGCSLDIVPNERLVWTSALTTGYRPQPGAMPFTAILELDANGSGGCTYRAIAVRQDPAGRGQHEQTGFHEGWAPSSTNWSNTSWASKWTDRSGRSHPFHPASAVGTLST